MKNVLQLKKELSILKIRFASYRISINLEDELIVGMAAQPIGISNKGTYEQRSVKNGFFKRARNSSSRGSWHR